MESSRCNVSLAMGFGYRSTVYENYTSEPEDDNRLLQCAFQRIMSDNYCKTGESLIDHNTMLCTHGTPIASVDTCHVSDFLKYLLFIYSF